MGPWPRCVLLDLFVKLLKNPEVGTHHFLFAFGSAVHGVTDCDGSTGI
jgi:hypothetical protein